MLKNIKYLFPTTSEKWIQETNIIHFHVMLKKNRLEKKGTKGSWSFEGILKKATIETENEKNSLKFYSAATSALKKMSTLPLTHRHPFQTCCQHMSGNNRTFTRFIWSISWHSTHSINCLESRILFNSDI